MAELTPRIERVSAWFDRTAAGRPESELTPLFGRALLALWDRAHLTLGEVTLSAVFDRVFRGARRRFPSFDVTGLRAEPAAFYSLIEQREITGNAAELEAIMRWVLSELLGLLGSLTGEILSEPLQAALESVQSPHSTPPQESLSKGEKS